MLRGSVRQAVFSFHPFDEARLQYAPQPIAVALEGAFKVFGDNLLQALGCS